jgi:MFS family permease
VYQVSDASSVLRAHRHLLTGRAAGRPVSTGGPAVARPVSRTVVLLGLTSLFTDVSSEMVATVLPLYLVYVGHFSPVAFGFVDGIQRGAAALTGLASGFASDRFRRHKEVAATGYGLSAVVKLGLVTAGTALSTISALVLVDRIGKGIRTAPRDAMISLATPREDLGVAFGVHRALDTTGAMLGPLLAFGILALAANAYTSVFLVSFCVAVIGVGILVLLVPQPRRERQAPDGAGRRRISLREALVVVRLPRFRALVLAAGALALATASDAFVFLVLQAKLDLRLGLFPLLFVGMTTVYMLLAVPLGRIADRIGRGRVLLGGYALLLGVYGTLLAPFDGPLVVGLALVLMGAYYAATDGVLAAFGSALVPDAVRASGLALLNTTTGVAKLVSSVLFGALWTLTSTTTAVAVFGAGLAAAMALAAVAFVRTRDDA